MKYGGWENTIKCVFSDGCQFNRESKLAPFEFLLEKQGAIVLSNGYKGTSDMQHRFWSS